MSKETLADSAPSHPHVINSPRERAILSGFEGLSDAALLVIVLGTGRRIASLATALVDDGLVGLARATVAELAQRAGVGPARAARIAASIELGRRAHMAASLESSPKLPNEDAVVRWARPRLAALDHEELWILALDGRQGLRSARRVASGGLHGLHVGVRDVLRISLKEAAAAFLLVHNHPSGDPAPSEEDIAFTRSVAEGAAVVGTPLLDHVIVARQRSSSMLELGLLAAPSPRGPAPPRRGER